MEILTVGCETVAAAVTNGGVLDSETADCAVIAVVGGGTVANELSIVVVMAAKSTNTDHLSMTFN